MFGVERMREMGKEEEQRISKPRTPRRVGRRQVTLNISIFRPGKAPGEESIGKYLELYAMKNFSIFEPFLISLTGIRSVSYIGPYSFFIFVVKVL